MFFVFVGLAGCCKWSNPNCNPELKAKEKAECAKKGMDIYIGKRQSKMRCVEKGTFDQPLKTEQPTETKQSAVQKPVVDTIALDSFCLSKGYNQGYVEYENDIRKTYCVKSNQIMERVFFQPNN